MDATHLHMELLHTCETGTVSVELQRRILDHALRNRANGVLVALLARTDLDAGIDRAIGDTRDIGVLTAWLLRDGRKPDEIVGRIATETRVAALSVIAETTGMPEDAYAALAAGRSGRVLRALVANPAVGREPAREAVRGIVTGKPRTSGIQTTIDDIANLVNQSRHRRDLWTTVGLHGSTLPHAIAVLENTRPDGGVIDRWSRSLEELHHHDDGRWKEATGRFVSEIVSCPLTLAQHARLLDAVDRLLDGAGDRNHRWVGELLAGRAHLRAYDVDSEQGIRSLRHETRPERAAALLEDLHPRCTGHQFQRLACAALANRALPIEAIHALRHSLGVPELGSLAGRIVAEGRRDLLHAWLDEYKKSIHPPVMLSFIPDRDEALETYLDHLAEHGTNWPGWTLSTRIVHERPALALAHVPWRDLSGRASTQPPVANLLAERIGRELADQEHWEAFETLGPTFEGTFDELVDVIASLS